MDIEQLAEVLYKITDEIDRKKALHKKEVAELQEKADKLEFAIRQFMQQNNLKNVSTERASFKLDMKKYTNISDWEAFTKFIHDRNDFAFVNKTVKKTEALAYLDAHGELPPGISMTQELGLSKRRK